MIDGAAGAFDRGLYALFSRHADSPRHDRDRRRYRGAGVGPSFDVFLARVYGLSWAAFALVTLGTAGPALAVPAGVFDAASALAHDALPVINRLDASKAPRR